jgi:hypothetical protein
MSSRRIGSGYLDINRVPDTRPDDRNKIERSPAIDEFATLLRDTQRHHQLKESAGLLRAAIIEFVTPRLSDSEILRSDRRVALLEHVISELLPRLVDGDGGRSLALKVMRDEVTRQRQLLALLQHGIAA